MTKLQHQTTRDLLHSSLRWRNHVGSGAWHSAYRLDDGSGEFVVRIPFQPYFMPKPNLKALHETASLVTPEIAVTGGNIAQPLLELAIPLPPDDIEILSIHPWQDGEPMPMPKPSLFGFHNGRSQTRLMNKVADEHAQHANPLTDIYRQQRDLIAYGFGDARLPTNLFCQYEATRFGWIDQIDEHANADAQLQRLHRFNNSASALARSCIDKFISGSHWDWWEETAHLNDANILRWPDNKSYMRAYERFLDTLDQAQQEGDAMPPALQFTDTGSKPRVQLGDPASRLLETLYEQKQKMLGHP